MFSLHVSFSVCGLAVQFVFIFSHSVAHLCGHLHSGGEYFNRLQMYARHTDGHLEIELSDWKFARR